MDSLFDASLFDAPKPAVVVDPPEPEPLPSLFDLLDDPTAAYGQPVVQPVGDASPSGAIETEVQEAAPAIDADLPVDGDLTEVLNDPNWEPPLDEVLEISETEDPASPDDVAAVDDEVGIDATLNLVDDAVEVEVEIEIEIEAEAEVEVEVEVEEAADIATADIAAGIEHVEDIASVDLVIEPLAADPVAAVVAPAESPRADELPQAEIDEGRAGFWSEIVGQGAAVSLLQASVPNPVHAYLFVGAPGSGKQAAALRFGAALVCPYGGCGRCNSCARALIQAHPDVLVVEREGASISVDQAREIIRLAARSPLEGDRKVLILVDFHLVTQAAPTLLKIIEEPPPSTVFVVLAEQITSELVTIASRCVTVGFAPLSAEAIARALVAEGASPDVAEKSAAASGGRLDRARLLATDPALGQRMSFWQMVPARLNGTGAAVSVLADEAVALLDAAAVGPLEARQSAELALLEARIEATGGRGGIGQRKELLERHKRELKRLRDDEVRLGLGVIQQVYRQTLSDPDSSGHEVKAALAAIDRINSANEQLVRNPNLGLWFRALFLDLPTR